MQEILNFITPIREAASVVAAKDVGAKPGLQSAEGQARLLHDLANIELQAVELGLKTLRDFPNAPLGFREELSAITREEASHLKLCLEGLKELGFNWGRWPVHTRLCDAVSPDDTLLERIFIVHCYLEGSGLDSGEILLRRLSAVHDLRVQQIVKKIVADEFHHVAFGVTWFRRVAESQGVDANSAMIETAKKLSRRLPVRGATLAKDIRRQVGFTDDELSFIEQLRPY